jgi:hypothetical protein
MAYMSIFAAKAGEGIAIQMTRRRTLQLVIGHSTSGTAHEHAYHMDCCSNPREYIEAFFRNASLSEANRSAEESSSRKVPS